MTGPDIAEQRAALTERIRVLIGERNAAEGSAKRSLEQQIEDARRQLKALR